MYGSQDAQLYGEFPFGPRSVCHNFLKGREATLPCSYRSTCFVQEFGDDVKMFITLNEPKETSLQGGKYNKTKIWIDLVRLLYSL